MHPSFRAIAAVVTVVALGACFDFDATTAGGLLLPDGGGDTSVPTMQEDGGAETGGSIPDASVRETGGIETGGGPDAGADVTTPVTVPDGGRADAGSYCASIATDAGYFFCEDFDEGAFSGNWSEFFNVGGNLDETDASALSPPYSLDEKTLPLQPSDPINVTLRKSSFPLPSFPATLRFGFSVELLQLDPSSVGAIVLSAIDFLNGENRYSLNVDINTQSDAAALIFAEQSGFDDGGTGYNPHPLPPDEPLPLNTWTNFVVEVDWTSLTAATATFSVNGNQEIAPVSLTMTVQATTLQIEIGTTYVNEPSSGWELRYDNVWFTIQ